MLIYRLTLPTYVDPMALAALNQTAPDVLYGTRMALAGLGAGTTLPAMRFLNGQRGLAAPEGGARPQLWLDTDWRKIGGGASPLTGLDIQTMSATLGFDLPLGPNGRVGLFGGYREFDGRLSRQAPLQGTGWTLGGYAAFAADTGLYAQVSAAWLGKARFKKIGRTSAYGQQAIGRTRGKGWAASGELGWQFDAGTFSITPFAALDYVDAKLDGYVETGASVSNLAFPDRDIKKFTASLRRGYSLERESGDDNATVRLASVQHAMGTVPFALADTERDSAFAELRIAMRQGAVSGYVSGGGRWGRGDDDTRVSLGVSYAF